MLVNGVAQQVIQISDRAVSYGDGVFETIRLHDGKAIYLEKHLQRLSAGCTRLKLNCDLALLEQEIKSLSPEFKSYGVLKIVLSRGVGGRGYRPEPDSLATRVLSLHDLPDYSQFDQNLGIQAFLCRQPLGLQPTLAGIKHLNRLEQVLASQEWPAETFFEGLMLDIDGRVIEGTKSNLFFAEAGQLLTPDLSDCGVNGVMRQVLLEAFNEQVAVQDCSLERLLKADEVFVCNSIFGVWPLQSLTVTDTLYTYFPGEFSTQARQIFEAALLAHAE